ncbi:ABC transporter ATP-binding protein [Clostridium sporogenes]|uniref:ABC transporter ATP-binding protein n=1 Tax=Clostridium botulinum TaxID=1491 RepID=UPI000717AB84|nr:ABC transporter ATP-binding protein [Clostridium botulinum]KRU24591.1 ABC transporter ATP-binding protein [Clostridium sporogenes]KRU25847.1 ABC transporter ATP-binding protein [Clostridium sporogenes]KRU32987.1 ABC transporter ATP-binding protein [Clostridium sporogenes]KRU42841.1 ABC transporter ATP-binding protein [Clostridium sporogenes]MBZ1329328.1 ABC transporter ATP-binding protein [Clostridium botulinum]
MLGDIKILLGEHSKKLRKPIILLTIDSLFNMFFYSMLYFVLLDLINFQLSFTKIKNYTIAMILAFIFRAIVNAIGYTGIQAKGARGIQSMRISLGDHIKNINLGFFNKNSIGSLSNIMTNDLQDFEKVITHSTSDLIKTVVLSVYLLIITFFIDVKLAIIQLAFVLVAMPIILMGGKKVTAIGKQKKEVMNEVISRMVEYLSGIQVFKAHNLAGEKFQRLEKSFRDLKRESIRTEVSIVPFVLIFQIIVDISFPVLLLIATTKFGVGNIDKKAFLTFIIINIALTNILRAFGAQYGVFRYLRLASQKLIKTYNQPEMSYKYEEANFRNYDIEFKNVSFKYKEGENTINNLSFKAEEGTMTALVGPSGSGKTTITSLIARFWDINSGAIKIGGKDIKDINPDSLLKHISMVFQDVYLLNDTIYNNIKLGNERATKDDVIKAAKIANCHEFIEKLEDKYDTIVGEGGATLSGGEKQRISIARAILKDAPIVLLDEATASLDADNELEIRKAIKKLTLNKTVIVIAHRLNTIKDADQIIVLNEGYIEEKGSHIELIKNKKRYYNMYVEMERAKNWAI